MSNKTPHFFVLEIPKREDRCPNAVYFVKTSSGVSMYVTNVNNKVYPVANGSSSSISDLVSPEGTISVEINGDTTEIDISQSILDELDAIRNAIVQPPNYESPFASISLGTTQVEVGETITRVVTSTFTQKDGGQPTAHLIKRGNTILSSVATSQAVRTVTDSIVVPRGTITYSTAITHTQGAVKQNNLGVEDPTGRIQAGTVTANRNIVGKLKIYYKVGSSFPSDGEELKQTATGFVYEDENEFTFEVPLTHMSIAIPADISLSNLEIKTSNNETITSDFLENLYVDDISDATNFQTNSYNIIQNSTGSNYNVTLTIKL